MIKTILMVIFFVSTIRCVALSGDYRKDCKECDCEAVYGDSPLIIRVAAGSPGELGLLKAVAEPFNQKNHTSICWVKAGSGEALDMLKQKKVDVVMVHAPAAEKQAIEEGWAAQRTLIGSNEFYIVGPLKDPAQILSAKSAAEAYRKIAEAKAKFFSRADNSGTHKKELAIWKAAGIQPAGDWYIINRDFMAATLKKVNDAEGYFMTDSSTWVAAKAALSNLKILFKGDPILMNTYHALCQPQNETGGNPDSVKFLEFLASEGCQKVIREFGKDKYGEALYNDDAYSEKHVQ